MLTFEPENSISCKKNLAKELLSFSSFFEWMNERMQQMDGGGEAQNTVVIVAL